MDKICLNRGYTLEVVTVKTTVNKCIMANGQSDDFRNSRPLTNDF